MFNCYEQVETAINELVETEFLQGDFLVQLGNGAYSEDEIRYFAVQYSYYSRHFPRVLGAAISAMPPYDSWWVPIADNLWDEAGRGGPGKAHERLYMTFLQSVYPDIRLDIHGVPEEPMSQAVSEAIESFIKFFHHASPLEAMAAVGLGSEMFAGTVMKAIADGFRHANYSNPSLNLLFWDVHSDVHEPRHYQLCKDILETFTHPNELQLMYETGAIIARSEAKMYQRLHDEMTAIG